MMRMRPPSTAQRSGAKIINPSTLIHHITTTTLHPACATPAPRRPPKRLWLDEEGRPSFHVSRFQLIAATRADAVTVRVIAESSIRPLPTVFATSWFVKRKNAKKFAPAAITIALFGDITRVATMVAIEFAESCIPLLKSNASASIMSKMMAGWWIATSSRVLRIASILQTLYKYCLITLDNRCETIGNFSEIFCIIKSTESLFPILRSVHIPKENIFYCIFELFDWYVC